MVYSSSTAMGTTTFAVNVFSRAEDDGGNREVIQLPIADRRGAACGLPRATDLGGNR